MSGSKRNACKKGLIVINKYDEDKLERQVRDAFDFKWHHPLMKKESYEYPIYDNDGRVLKTIKIRCQTKDKRWIKLFKNETRLDTNFINGKIALDVGCGFGRNSYALLELGAKQVVAFDFSPSAVTITQKELSNYNNIEVLQADLFNIPFKPKSFDIVLAMGVLHHTHNTKKAFESVSKMVKPGGFLCVHIYERYNPLRIFLTNILRRIIQEMSFEEQMKFLQRYLAANDDFRRHPLQRVRWMVLGEFIMFGYKSKPILLFDAYSPRYNHTHTVKEVLSWYKKLNFNKIMITQPFYRRATGGEKLRGQIRMRGKKMS